MGKEVLNNTYLFVGIPSWQIDAVRALLASMLTQSEIQFTENPIVARNQLSCFHPKAILIACNFAQGDLTELIDEVHRLLPATRCICLVEYFSEEQTAFQIGADDILDRNFTAAQFMKKVMRGNLD